MLEEKLRGAFNKILGDYVPNQVDMDNLTNYMYKLIVFLSKDVDMNEEYKNIKSFTQLDEDGFKKAIKDIALFTSQRVMLETLNRTYKEIKNTVPAVKVDRLKGEVAQETSKREQTKMVMTQEPEFQIDLSTVPKVKKPRKHKDGSQNKSNKVIATEMDASGLIDIDKANKNMPNVNVNTNSNNDSDGGDGDFTLGAGILGGDNFSAVPDIDISLDY